MKSFAFGLFGVTWLVVSSPLIAQPLFSLERGSPTLVQNNLSPADLFIDDTDVGGPPDVELPAAGLGLPFNFNVDALSSGRENAGLAWLDKLFLLPFDNPLHSQRIFYFFSADTASQDQIPPGMQPIPHFPLQPTISSTNRFAGSFAAGNQAGDFFQNQGTEAQRFNDLFIQAGDLDLLAGDDLDALSDLLLFGGDLDREDINGDDEPDGILDNGVTVYFSVDPLSGNLDPGTVYQVTGNGPVTPFASTGQLGLAQGDDIDALCIFQDLVAFSLAAGSTSLPFTFQDDPNGVPITQGGIFLAQIGVGLLTGLPAQYFGLQPTDELNALHCVDPEPAEVATCDTDVVLTQEDGVAAMPRLLSLKVGSQGKVVASLPTSQRDAAEGGISLYKVFASVEDPEVARLVDTSVEQCGPDGPGGDCFECGPEDAEPPCKPNGDSVLAFRLEPPLNGRDLCLGDFTLEGLEPGLTTITLEASLFGPEGEPLETVSQKSLVVVEGKKKPGKGDTNSDNDG